jgi:hypothetical protein
VGLPAAAQPQAGPSRARLPGAPAAARRRGREVLVAAGFLALGVAATWPRASYLTGILPAGGDQAQYVWNLWWAAHLVVHPGDPWFTHYLAAPVGVPLAYDTLTPLVGVLMAPVTLAFGPSASFTLLAAATPGLAAYAAYRAAGLWLPGLAGPLAAGSGYGMAAMLTWQDWYHINIAMGAVFLPLALATAIQLRRSPTLVRGMLPGLVVGSAVLVDQESAVLAGLVAAAALLPWVARGPRPERLAATAAAVLTAAVLASPQLAAMALAGPVAGHDVSRVLRDSHYALYTAGLPGLVAPSPRVADIGLSALASVYRSRTPGESLATFGLVLSVLGVCGLAAAWRRPGARQFGLARGPARGNGCPG